MWISDLIAGSVPWIIPAILLGSFLVNNKESLPKKKDGSSAAEHSKTDQQVSDKDMTG